MHSLELRRPDDWHVHLRDDVFLQDTVPGTAHTFARALIMPNLSPPLTTLQQLIDYRARILASLPQNTSFTPYMTFYLNESTHPDDFSLAKKYPEVLGAKLYPAGATTNSQFGATSIQALYPLFEAMQTYDLVLQIHGEVILGDIFEREALFLKESLGPIIHNFPKLRIVLEHISTHEAVEFVRLAPATVSATITPHHLMYNRNHLLAGGLKPHYYCMPILKHARDQDALQTIVRTGNPKFFAGTDSAPHAREMKESSCGCAGIYSAPYALAMYAQTFESLDSLHRLNDFMSRFGAEFYQLPLNQDPCLLIKKPQHIPKELSFGSQRVVPACAGETLEWSLYEAT